MSGVAVGYNATTGDVSVELGGAANVTKCAACVCENASSVLSDIQDKVTVDILDGLADARFYMIPSAIMAVIFMCAGFVMVQYARNVWLPRAVGNALLVRGYSVQV